MNPISEITKARMQELVALKRLYPELTMTEFGRHFGVSRQRVLQIIDRLPAEERELFRWQRKPIEHIKCEVCLEETVKTHAKQRFCSRKCQMIPGTQEERHVYELARKRKRYATSSETREKHKKSYYAYLKRMKKDPVRFEKYKRQQREATQRYNERKKAKSV